MVLLTALLSCVVWGLFGGGFRQSELNVGRAEALIGALLALDHLEQDLRSMCLSRSQWETIRKTSVSDLRNVLPIVNKPGSRTLEIFVARSSTGAAGGPVSLETVTWALSAPTPAGWRELLRNTKAVKGVRLKELVFVPRVPPPQARKERFCLLQTFVKATDSSGRHDVTLMGLTRLRAVLDAATTPYWNPIPDGSYLIGPEPR